MCTVLRLWSVQEIGCLASQLFVFFPTYFGLLINMPCSYSPNTQNSVYIWVPGISRITNFTCIPVGQVTSYPNTGPNKRQNEFIIIRVVCRMHFILLVKSTCPSEGNFPSSCSSLIGQYLSNSSSCLPLSPPHSLLVISIG